MTDITALYPPNPANVPPDLTATSWRYRWKAVVVLIGLFVFLFLYLAMLAGAAYLLTRIIISFTGRNADELWAWKLLAAFGASLILLVLLRGLVRWSRLDRDRLMEIREADQPTFFAFLRRLCADLKAPLPRRVFLSPEVNAAMVASTSLLTLVRPARRDLMLGLGLVNFLNLTEFKAVLAHELGHFSQRSSRLTGYVYTANPVMADLVYRRDWLDHQVNRAVGLLLRVASIEIRLLALTVVLTGPLLAPLAGLWLFRVLLEKLYRVINFQNLALLRQMELNADLVAASVTGSDAPVHVLARIAFASELLTLTAEELAGAADHGIYSRDLFYHQTRAAGYLRQLLKDPQRGEPPPLPDDPAPPPPLFGPGDDQVVPMWATHPPHHEREQNLRRRYVRSTFDRRSTWLLFHEPEKLRTEVTERFYRGLVGETGDLPLSDPEAVQAVIEAERTATTYDPRYLGAYDDRFLEPGDLDALTAEADREPWETERVAQTWAKLFDGERDRWLEDHRRRWQEIQSLAAASADVELEFRGQRHPPGSLAMLRNRVSRELEDDRLRLAELDREVFRVHYQLSRASEPTLARELIDRYRFHQAAQAILGELNRHLEWLGTVLQYLSSTHEITETDYHATVEGAMTASEELGKALATANTLTLPALPHVAAGKALGEFLRPRDMPADFRLAEKDLQPKKLMPSLHTLWGHLGAVQDRLRRVYFKSLGGILALQEKIREKGLPLAEGPAGAGNEIPAPS